MVTMDETWTQKDQLVLSTIQSSLDGSILEAYSYCESSFELWETLKKVYGNTSNLSRVFEVKRAINNLSQEDLEFTAHFGKFRSLWAELEMLRPSSLDPEVLRERREQDKVFGLLLTMNPTYNDLIKHILRSDKLPTLEEVCAQIQREQGSQDLFGGKSELVTANRGELMITANKGSYRRDERRIVICDHCKKRGHTKDKCWILHPHLKPNKFKDAKAYQGWEGNDQSGITPRPNSCEGKALIAAPAQEEWVKKSDLDALIKALKDNSGKVLGKSLHASIPALNNMKPLIVDSGASHHMISDLSLISNMKPTLASVTIANGDRVPIKGIGNLKLFSKESKAFYLPSFTSNLISVKKATNDLNCNVIFSPNDVKFQDIETSQVIGKGGTKEGLYLLEDFIPESNLSCALSSSSSSSISISKNALWHARLGHPHSRALSLMLPNVTFANDDCEACILGKHCKSVFPKSNVIYKNCFDLVHSDVWTAPCISRDNHRYFVTFIDEKSKYTWITLIQSKDRVLEAFTNFQNYVTNHFNAKIKIFRSDNGGEYTSFTFKKHLEKHGILHQTSCPYTPQQNGVAERKNRHLMEVARSMMFHSNVPKRFWSDAVLSACYLINRIPTKILNDTSPFEVLNSTKPSLDYLCVFGCVCFVLVPGELRNKLEAKSTKAMFIGYSTTQKGYKCYVPDTRRVLVSREVKFLEEQGYYAKKSWEELEDLSTPAQDRATNLRIILEHLGSFQPPTAPIPSTSTRPNSEVHLDREGETQAGNEGETQSDDDHNEVPPQMVHNQDAQSADSEVVIDDQNDQEEQEQDQPLRRSTRLRRDPSNWVNTRVYYNAQAVAHPTQAVCSFANFPEEHKAFMTSIDQNTIPRTYEEAKELKIWRDAVKDEKEAMERNHTWDEADLPMKKKAVSSKWVFTIKYKSNGEIERYKARLVARGFTQTYGEDFGDTFAPVAKLHTVRIILSLATNLDWELMQMDVKNAFLQGELEEEVYMTPPPGLEETVTQGKVLRLRKAIYGLKQSPRAWYHKLSMTLRDRGFRRSEADHTLFTLSSQSGIIVVLVYVDDIIISGSDKEGIQSTKAYLKSVFDIKDLGLLKYFLGIEVCRSKEGLFLSQRKYTLDLLSETGMLETKSVSTPLEDGYKVINEGETEDQPYEDPKNYRRLVGKLIYLTLTRPDLCFAVNQVSQHMQAPKLHHWKMLERVLRYLSGAPGQGIWMGCNKSSSIVGYCDADWAGDKEDRRSTTGYCTFVGGNLVTWKTKKQKVVSCSSAESEYRAMRKLTNELIWMKAVLKDLGIEDSRPITMHCDNQAAIHIASNSMFHERTKHIEIDCHKVRQEVEKGTILPCYTRSEDQLADIFTKAASSKVCESIYPRLGLMNLPCP